MSLKNGEEIAYFFSRLQIEHCLDGGFHLGEECLHELPNDAVVASPSEFFQENVQNTEEQLLLGEEVDALARLPREWRLRPCCS